MSSNNSVAHYEAIILPEIGTITDAQTARLIYDLIAYAKKEEEKADNRELRPRPDGSENAAYYQGAINFGLITSSIIQNALTELLAYTSELENLLENAD